MHGRKSALFEEQLWSPLLDPERLGARVSGRFNLSDKGVLMQQVVRAPLDLSKTMVKDERAAETSCRRKFLEQRTKTQMQKHWADDKSNVSQSKLSEPRSYSHAEAAQVSEMNPLGLTRLVHCMLRHVVCVRAICVCMAHCHT